jgi:hypothetical protein
MTEGNIQSIHEYYAHQLYSAIEVRKQLVVQLNILQIFVNDEILRAVGCIPHTDGEYITAADALERTKQSLLENGRVIRELADRYIEVATYVGVPEPDSGDDDVSTPSSRSPEI